jgi:hypothetical protein
VLVLILLLVEEVEVDVPLELVEEVVVDEESVEESTVPPLVVVGVIIIGEYPLATTAPSLTIYSESILTSRIGAPSTVLPDAIIETCLNLRASMLAAVALAGGTSS